MTPLQNLYYAIGELAYAIAIADKRLQPEELSTFMKIVNRELDKGNSNFDITRIIFDLMKRENPDTATAYERAMKEIKLNSHYLSPELKKQFILVIEEIAKAFAPVTSEENTLIENFKKEIDPINGDPVYYAPLKIFKN